MRTNIAEMCLNVKWEPEEQLGTKGLKRSTTESVNEKTQVCRFFRALVENLQNDVSCYEKNKSDRSVYKKLSTIFKERFWAKSDFSTELSTVSTKIDREN